MPIWLQILASIGGLSGVTALVGSAIGFGRVLEKIENVCDKIQDIPNMVQDISYLKGRLDGVDQAHLLEVLRPPVAPTRPQEQRRYSRPRPL